MATLLDPDGERRLQEYFDGIGDVLKTKKARASFAMYAMGILGDGERKSVEPIAARAAADPATTDAMHQRLLHFLNQSSWSDRGVRRYAARHAVAAATARLPVDAWIVDDTGWLKQGKHSVGVQRQYTGSAGKVTNCQVGVSLALATANEHVPVDFELYLPESWANDPARRAEAAIPDEVPFKTKPDLALDMVRRALLDDLPRGVVLADTAYGNSSAFRAELRRLGLHYAVAVDATTKVHRFDGAEVPPEVPIDVRAYAAGLSVTPKAFRRVTWREGTKRSLSARFAIRWVIPFHDDGTPVERRERVLLVCEWPDDDRHPTKYYFVVPPSTMSRKRLIRLIKERWRTERMYEDLKGELGLDHFEGRRFPGWHHHVSVVLACYAFVVAERARRFPPSAGRAGRNDPLPLAA